MTCVKSSRDKTEEVKKLGDKKKATRKRHLEKGPEKQLKSEDKQMKPSVNGCPEFKCKFCGCQQRHVKKTECPAFGKTCSKCERKGHFSSVCYAGKKVNQLEDFETSSEDETCLTLETK